MTLPARHILVTGASGFVGTAVVRELLRTGWRIAATTASQAAMPVQDPRASLHRLVTWRREIIRRYQRQVYDPHYQAPLGA